MPAEVSLPENDPIMIAWNEYRETEAYHNSLKWAEFEQHREGSLWAAFLQGYIMAKRENENAQSN